MGFWLFMFSAVLLCPAVMLGLGYRFKTVGAPAKINYLFGYRTGRSMKNRETWEFAHRRCGIYWWKAGWVTLIVSAAAMLFFLRSDMDTTSIAGTAIVLVQLFPLCGVIVYVERGLRSEFDENGNRISKVEV